MDYNKSRIDGNENRDFSIDLLRFPLAVAVIFVHSHPQTVCLQATSVSIVSSEGIYNLLAIIISQVLASVAVPTFFIISGFLFFRNLKQWNWHKYKEKLKNRFKTLVVPYVTWNALVFASYILLKSKSVLVGGETWSSIIEYIDGNWLRCFYNYSNWETMGNIFGCSTYMTAPIDTPLWFLRDLIIVIVLSPFVYYYINKCKLPGIIILMIAYISNIWFEIPGFNITSVLFFSLGGYIAINGKNLACKSNFNIIFMISLILFIPCVYTAGSNTVLNLILMKIFIISSVFLVISISSWIVRRYKIRPVPLLVDSCFFIYASHTVYLLNFSEHIANKIIPGENPIIGCIHYLITPIITVLLCVTIYYIISKYFKRLSLPLTGRLGVNIKYASIH